MSLKYGILGLLHRSPMTGYNLKKLFDQTLNNVWNASLSQIYRELGLLQKDGYVLSEVEEQDDRPDKRVYHITEEGTHMFCHWLCQAPDSFLSPKRDEFMLKFFFGSVLGAREVIKQLEEFKADRQRAIQLLDRNILLAGEMIAGYRGGVAVNEEEELYIRLIVDRAQRTNHLLVEWAQDSIRALEGSLQQNKDGEEQP